MRMKPRAIAVPKPPETVLSVPPPMSALLPTASMMVVLGGASPPRCAGTISRDDAAMAGTVHSVTLSSATISGVGRVVGGEEAVAGETITAHLFAGSIRTLMIAMILDPEEVGIQIVTTTIAGRAVIAGTGEGVEAEGIGTSAP